MDDEQLFDELLGRLNSEGDSAEYSYEQGGVLLYRFQGIDHDPPFVLHVDARTLGEHLRAMGGLRELFPDESPASPAWSPSSFRSLGRLVSVLAAPASW